MTGTGNGNDAGGPHSTAPKTPRKSLVLCGSAQNVRLLRACRVRS